MTFAYDIMVRIHIISTASNLIIKSQDTMTFAYDIMVRIHSIISLHPI